MFEAMQWSKQERAKQLAKVHKELGYDDKDWYDEEKDG